MPQMSPMDWFFLNIYFLMIYIIVMGLIYFLMFNSLIKFSYIEYKSLNNYKIIW